MTGLPGSIFLQALKMDIQKIIDQGIFLRSYRKCELVYSLNPAIAYAINILAEPDKGDRILDPCCGSGTILIERQLLNQCKCTGVDIDPRALECAKQNTQAAGVEIEFLHGNIMEKKFPDGYFTKIISNLPYGIHAGSREKNIELYKFLADKAIKWLKPGGKAVFITNAKSLLRNTFAYNGLWELLSETPLQVGGLQLSIFIYQI